MGQLPERPIEPVDEIEEDQALAIGDRAVFGDGPHRGIAVGRPRQQRGNDRGHRVVDRPRSLLRQRGVAALGAGSV